MNYLTINTPQQWFSAARLLAMKKLMPYLAPAMMDLIPIEKQGLGTFGVTDRGVVMWDPDLAKPGKDGWSIEEAAWTLCHEALHYIRDHGGRFKSQGLDDHQLWNVCGDCEINDDLEEAGCIWLGKNPKVNRGDPTPARVTAETGIQLDNGDLAEGYYAKLRKGGKKGSGGSGKGASKPGQQGQGQGAGEGEGRGKGSGQPQPGRNGKGCGSGAGGEPLPGEEDIKEGRGAAHKVRVAREVAEEIRKHVRQNGIGSVPAGMRVWAEEVLGPPRVRWQDRLARLCRQAIAYRKGAGDFTYNRPSRRQGAHGYANGQPIVPGMHVPIPRVAVAVDTSGSMGSDELKEAMTEVKGILLAAGARVEFIACDAEVHAKGTITTFQQATRMLKGGGGTDFRPVFDELEKRRGNRPELLVFLTDGYGPAPEKQPSFKTIWFLVGPNTTPPAKWGETIAFGKTEAEEAA